MKNLLAVTGIILLVCIVITSTYSSDNANAAPEQLSSEPQISQISSEQSDVSYYVLSVYEKKVAAFENGKNIPFYIRIYYQYEIEGAF